MNNTGRCTLNFKVSLEERVKTQLDYMDVNPKCGSIFPGEIFPIKVDYLPGIPGIFNKRFILEVIFYSVASISYWENSEIVFYCVTSVVISLTTQICKLLSFFSWDI